jgi:hypothetical protein
VKFGTRSGGVIDVAPRSVDSGYEQRVGASLLSYDLATVGQGETWPIEWLATVRHSTRDIVLKPLDGEIGEPGFYDAVGRLRWQGGAGSAWSLGWLLLNDRVHLATGPQTERADAHYRDLYAWLSLDWAPSGALHSRSSLSTTDAERSRDAAITLTDFANGQMHEHRSFSNVDLRSDWTYLPSAEITWNFGAQTSFETAQLLFTRAERFADSVALSFARPADATLTSNLSPRSSTQGLYASARRHWQDVEVELGTRLDRQQYRGFGSHAQLSTRLHLRYDPTDLTNVYASWGQFTQAQRISEWRSEENQSTPDPVTRAVHLIAGVAHETAGAIHWRLEAYRNHWAAINPYYDNALDPVSLLAELEPDRLRVAPLDAEASGIELSVRRAFGSHVEAWGGYAWSHVTDDLAVRDVPRSWDQTNAAKFGLAWHGTQTTASVFVGWHSGWPRTPFTVTAPAPGSPYLLVGARNSARWGDYLSADLRLARTIPLASGELSLWLDGTNISNRKNPCCVGLTPADLGTNVTPSIVENWLPRVINLGFSWRLRRTP